jgi:hypothetical protein
VWFPNRRHKVHQANWQVTNEAENRTWPILDELDLAVVVEHEGPFEADVAITAARPNCLLARIFSQSWWSKDHPLLFNGSTSKGLAPSTLKFNELNESDWAQLIPFSGVCHIPKPHAENKDSTYRVRAIPNGYGKEEVRIALCAVCKIDVGEITVSSLAKNPHRDEMVATVSFMQAPAILKGKDRDEWSLQYFPSHDFQNTRDTGHGEDTEIIHLVFDRHFRGFTPLWSPESDSKHMVE